MPDSHVPTNDFIDLMYSNGFYPLISKLTRITSHSATLIDKIFSNDLDNHKFSGILWSDISDHLPIYFRSLIVPLNQKLNLQFIINVL